ncbi:small nucleolar RNP protein [Blastocystis sp. ATCC 50177/Nand II]|uniref:H/ACA ribonucleoprotein complex subunit n=1 Tax=Blastocystis sp. subtype 1 (strain ATCC 50177 / NandII) TaxID=478820 RepID=A0A196SQD2_BLAHN|nr:small nucleolar RNP protein [Blastocystis sp. ATCC 50177/Nand II]
MSFRGGRGGNRGGRGGNFGGRRDIEEGPPERVVELGFVMHEAEGDLLCKSTNEMIPYFNAPVYLENKTKIGKVDEILGAISDVHFSMKCDEGVKASSFKKGDKVYINPMKLLPLSRFTETPKPSGGARGGRGGSFGGRGGRGGAGGRGGSFGGRGGRGGSFGGRGGRGGSFGGGRGGRGGSFGGRKF